MTTPKDLGSSESIPQSEQGADRAGVPPGARSLEDQDNKWSRIKTRLRARFGEDIYTSWFGSMELVTVEDTTARISVPTRFLKSWIQGRYASELLESCKAELPEVGEVQVILRQPGAHAGTRPGTETRPQPSDTQPIGAPAITGKGGRSGAEAGGATADSGGFQGSPLDKRMTFASFEVGKANSFAHGAAKQVAEAVVDERPSFNPLYIHSNVGLGKTHLLHAIAWEVKRRNPLAQVLYLTAERFRWRFVQALNSSQEAMNFKDLVRNVNVFLIDDMEFLHGERTEQEFDHTLNALLDGGKQVVVASARAPMQLESLDARMRSRLSGGLVIPIEQFDKELRLRILERRVDEKRATKPNFMVSPDVLEFLAEKLTESGREIEGAITRIFAESDLERAPPIGLEQAERIVHDLVQNQDHRRVKIDDILRVVSKQYGVSRTDILSERRQRSIVWPRQIGMFLAKVLTQRSLPEIGRRFGGRDHTTVLHAIRKIEGELKTSSRLRAELDDLRRLLLS